MGVRDRVRDITNQYIRECIGNLSSNTKLVAKLKFQFKLKFKYQFDCLRSALEWIVFTVALFRYLDFFGLLFFMSPCIVNSMPSPMATSSCVCSLIPFLIRPSARISSCPSSSSLSPCSADIQRQTPLPFVSHIRS